MRIVALVVLFLTTFQISAQNERQPWYVGLGWNAVDYYNSEETDKQINTTFSALRISVGRHIWKGLSAEFSYSVNEIEEYPGLMGVNLDHAAIDAYALYSFRDLLYNGEDKLIDPYLMAGAGITWLENFGVEEKIETNTLNIGGGVNFWISPSLAIVGQGVYKNSKDGFTDSYLEYYVGIKYIFGLRSGGICFP
ncbi:MAG TPA: outer membrane beta-barrel protein [Salinimicrobium sp.]|nr:outer membrane beta-barrel protein [Salinimicrobium sp.]